MPDEEGGGSAGIVFSVLMASFNAAPYIGEAIGSAISQLGPDDELVVQDGASDDGTVGILTDWSHRDARIKLVVEPDEGQSDALNRALARTKPSWVVWLNADDLLVPGALNAVREAIASHPAAEVFRGRGRLMSQDAKPLYVMPTRELDVSTLLRRGPCAFSGSIVVRDSTLREIGGFRRDLRFTMDLDLQIRLARRGLPQAAVDAEIGALRFHDQSKSGTEWRGFVAEAHRLRRESARSPAESRDAWIGLFRHLAAVQVVRMRLARASLAQGRSIWKASRR